MKQKLRVLLAISQPLVRVGLSAQIATAAPEIELVEAANSLQIQQNSCDVVIIHQALLSELIGEIQIPFLVLTEQPTQEELLQLRENMLCYGYVSPNFALEPLLSYFYIVNFKQRNSFWLDPYITLSLIQLDDVDNFEFEIREKLSAREYAVFVLLKQKKTTHEIAETLGIATCTVRTHKQKICQKLGVEAYGLKELLAQLRSKTVTAIKRE